MHVDGFMPHGPISVVPLVEESFEPELDFEADLRAQDAWRESQMLQETGGLGSMNRGLMRPGGRHTIVCKHWLRDLCMKGDKCDFLHQYDLARMPECLQWARFGKCPDNDCDFRHDTERMECQKYKYGFCKLGSQCRMRHDKISRAYLPEVMPDWYLKELVPNIFDFVPKLPEEAVRVTNTEEAQPPPMMMHHPPPGWNMPGFAPPPVLGWNVPMVPQDAWAAPQDAWAAPQHVVDLTAENDRAKNRNAGKGSKGKGSDQAEPRREREPGRRENDSRDAWQDRRREEIDTRHRSDRPEERRRDRSGELRTENRDSRRDDRREKPREERRREEDGSRRGNERDARRHPSPLLPPSRREREPDRREKPPSRRRSRSRSQDRNDRGRGTRR